MASEAVGTQVKIRLSYFDAAGYQSRLEQLCTGSVTVPVCHFLADDEIDGPLSVVGHRDPRHSHACLYVYASTATLCVFESTAEGTWILPPGWSSGVSNVLDRIPVRTSSNEQETLIQLRPGDQILSKGGRWSVDFFAREMTPNPLEENNNPGLVHTQASKHPHYAQLHTSEGFLPTAPATGHLHQLLELNEPSRAVIWVKAAYDYEEHHAVLQVSVCEHYRSTFGAHGSLISPLTLLKAFKHAFPLALTNKRLNNGLEYVVEGIRLRESVSENSQAIERDQAAATIFSSLREIHFDAECVSPDILEGMKTSTWKVMEDFQAESFVNAYDNVRPYGDHHGLQHSTIEQDSSDINEPVEPEMPSEKRMSLQRDDILSCGTRNLASAAETRLITAGVASRDGSHDRQDPASPAVYGAKPMPSPSELQVCMASSNSAIVPSPNPALKIDHNGPPLAHQTLVNKLPALSSLWRLERLAHAKAQSGTASHSAEQVVEKSSIPVRGELHDLDGLENGVKSATKAATHKPKKTVSFARLPNEDVDSTGDGLDEGQERTPSRSRIKRKRQPSRQAAAPAKKTKTGGEPSLTEVNINENSPGAVWLELDGEEDTVVMGGGPTASDVSAEVGTWSKNPMLRTPVRSEEKNDSIQSHGASSCSRPSLASLSNLRDTESGSAGQYSGKAPSIIFSSSTAIATDKQIMRFLRECGGKSVKNIARATMLCVTSDPPLKKTAKFILALCMGLDIVTDKWLIESQRKGALLDPQQYLPKDPQREREWKFKLGEAIARGKMQGGLTSLLTGTDVYFLHDLKALLGQNFRDFTSIATCLGADAVRNGLPNGRGNKDVLILGTADDSQTLQACRLGHDVWSKDLLVMGALRGAIQPTDEFIVMHSLAPGGR